MFQLKVRISYILPLSRLGDTRYSTTFVLLVDLYKQVEHKDDGHAWANWCL